MKSFGWQTRLRYGAVAALVAWLAGWLAGVPFEVGTALRYVDGRSGFASSLAEGLVVWAGFSLFMAVTGFVPVLVPVVLLAPPRWVVRWRVALLVAAPLLAMAAINDRMGLLNFYHVRHPRAVREFFFTAPNFFLLTFALVVVWVYTWLARRRLRVT